MFKDIILRYFRRATPTVINPEIVRELEPAVRALQPHGFAIVATEGGGMMFWADFRSTKALLRIVKDRGYWHIDGDTEDLKQSPSRKSQSAAIRDALEWITKLNA